ncbi:VraH family protein [Staphylococcus pseudintermedius]|nr:VraH family protein [Staphylococcus pseudintermedius]MDF0154023.1 VraH family protein [Staphylococcus pseudintermedius]
MMKVRDYFERVKENLLDMKIGSKSFVIMIVSMVLLSMIFTPFIGILAGAVIGSYAYERY